jgi:hypothetical protein
VGEVVRCGEALEAGGVGALRVRSGGEGREEVSSRKDGRRKKGEGRTDERNDDRVEAAEVVAGEFDGVHVGVPAVTRGGVRKD